jgi:phage shock protein A
MSPRIVERVDDWEAVQFGGGYAGLHELAAQEFSGVVTAGPARLCFIRGTVVGVLDGDIDDFADAGGTAREAPHSALPLLAVMQERSEEVRAKYYTEDTAIADVDRTLADGNFTGYVELAENVLSGDYYQVYHQGRSMSVAVVGTAERLLTDDEAFEKANDEVGIYEVRPVDIEPVEIPEPEAGGTAGTAAGQAGAPVEQSAAETADEGDADAAGSAADETQLAASEGSPAETADPATDSTGDTTVPAADDHPAAGTTDSVDAGSTGETTQPEEAAETVAEASTESDPDQSLETDPDTADPDGESQATPDREPADTTDADQAPGKSTDGADAGGVESPPERQSGMSEQPSKTTEQPSGTTESTASGTTEQPSKTTEQPSGTTGSTASGTTGRTGTTGEQAGKAPSEQAGGSSHQQGQPSSPRRASGPQDRATSGPDSPADLETRAIPSLNPSRTASTEQERAVSGEEQTQQRRSSQPNAGSTAPGDTQPEPSQQTQAADASTAGGPSEPAEQARGSQPPEQSAAQGQAGGDNPESQATTSATADAPAGEDQETLERELAEREEELSELKAELESVTAARSDLSETADELRAERDRLEADLEEARAEIDRLETRLSEAEAAGPADTEVQLGRAEALDKTNLFVRYESKGEATLEAVHDGNASRDAIANNLRLEYHTQFDADVAAVGPDPFEEFLHGTIQYRFVEWLVTSLVYDIRDTGHTDEMGDLYAALPKVDRAELNGEVSVTYTENGQETRAQERFDVVVRDRMGNPLVVANINNSRDPATNGMMTDLIQRGERVGESNDSLVAAVLVTESFFEPAALETADEATSSGLLSRDSRKSFVNLSRKGGYHLCLVEARNQEFHMAVPEL